MSAWLSGVADEEIKCGNRIKGERWHQKSAVDLGNAR